MSTPTTPLPTSPSSHTRALWPIDPAPAYWPTLPNHAAPATKRSRDLAALTNDDAARRAAREAVDLRYTRRMVAECAALLDGEGVVL